MLKEFREFILRGNLIDLAVAVVIGTAFAAVIAALVADLVTPLIAADRRRARLLGAQLHDQRQRVPLRALPRRAADVRDRGRGDVLPRDQAGQRPARAGAAPSRRRTSPRAPARSASATSRRRPGAARSAPRRSRRRLTDRFVRDHPQPVVSKPMAIAVEEHRPESPEALAANLGWLLARASHSLATELTAALTELARLAARPLRAGHRDERRVHARPPWHRRSGSTRRRWWSPSTSSSRRAWPNGAPRPETAAPGSWRSRRPVGASVAKGEEIVARVQKRCLRAFPRASARRSSSGCATGRRPARRADPCSPRGAPARASRVAVSYAIIPHGTICYGLFVCVSTIGGRDDRDRRKP